MKSNLASQVPDTANACLSVNLFTVEHSMVEPDLGRKVPETMTFRQGILLPGELMKTSAVNCQIAHPSSPP